MNASGAGDACVRGGRALIQSRVAGAAAGAGMRDYHSHLTVIQSLRSYIIEHERLLIQKTENRYLTVLVAPWGVNRCRKALFGVISRPDTPTAVFAGETVEL